MSNPILSFIKEVFKKSFKVLRKILVLIFSFLIISITLTSLGGAMIGFGQKEQSNQEILVDSGSDNKIITVQLKGIISSSNNTGLLEAGMGSITPEYIEKTLRDIQKDVNIKAVIFDINSPGGSPVASDQIYEDIKEFKQQTNIPVVFLMRDLATSGGYYISSIANIIVANPATITGSIGVITESYNLEGLYEKLGVEKLTFKQGKYKDILSESREITDAEKEIIDQIGKNTYEMFIKKVAEGRNMNEEQVKILATGQVYSGNKAKELGLVDDLGNFSEAVYQAKSLANIQNFKIVRFKSGSFWEQLVNGVKQNFNLNIFSNLTAPKTLYRQY